MNLQTALTHLQRVRHQLGEPLTLKSNRYRVRGYSGNRLAANVQHEPHLMRVFENAIRSRTGAFIDVGTNVGQTFTKILAIDPSRRYVGFDPQLECCFYLEQFIRDNALQNATVLPIALSDENRILTLYSSDAADEMATVTGAIDATGTPRRRTAFVAARIGDEVMAELGIDDVAAIKIDVEGAELQVLEGLADTLMQHKPVVIFEVLPNFYGVDRRFFAQSVALRNRRTAQAIYAFLTNLGYEISQIDHTGDHHRIERFDLDNPATFVGRNYVAFAR
jgi:FkbM family methyltransferase